MPLTYSNLTNTLNYWWGLAEHKNTLINWQRQNTRETLINNRNRVHAERRRLVQLLLDDTYPCTSRWAYRVIKRAGLGESQYISNNDNLAYWPSNTQYLPNDNQNLI